MTEINKTIHQADSPTPNIESEVKISPFNIAMNVFDIQGNIVVCRPKVASTTCGSIVYNIVNEVPKGQTLKFPAEEENEKISYQRIRELSNFWIEEVDGKFRITPMHKGLGRRKIDNPLTNEASDNYFKEWPLSKPRNQEEEDLVLKTIRTFYDITQGKSNKKIYWLIREPENHWMAGIYEDFKFVLERQKVSDVVKDMMDWFEKKNLKNHLEYRINHMEVLHDYANGKYAYFQDRTDERYAFGTGNFGESNFGIESCYWYIQSRYLHPDIVHHDNGLAKFNEFKRNMFLFFWDLVLGRHRGPEYYQDIMSDISKQDDSTTLYYMVSQHYYPYLTQSWGIFSRVYFPEYVKWIDINNTSLKIIKRTKETAFTNTRNDDIKHNWNTSFREVLSHTRVPGPHYLLPEKFTWQQIKNYNEKL